MSYQNVSRVLSNEEFDGIKQGIGGLNVQVSAIAVNLSVEDRSTMQKMGDKSLGFTGQALKYGIEQKDAAAPYLDVQEFQKDWDLANQTKELLKLLEQVVEKLSDTHIAAGADAYAAARKFYTAAKAAAKAGVPGFDVIVAELKKRYYPRKKAVTERKEETTS